MDIVNVIRDFTFEWLENGYLGMETAGKSGSYTSIAIDIWNSLDKEKATVGSVLGTNLAEDAYDQAKSEGLI